LLFVPENYYSFNIDFVSAPLKSDAKEQYNPLFLADLFQALLKMKERDAKDHVLPEKMSKHIPRALILLSLCAFAFYLGGLFCTEKDGVVINSYDEFSVTKNCQPQVKPSNFQECNISLQDITPCTDPHVLIFELKLILYLPC
jgi:hypothetical protein